MKAEGHLPELSDRLGYLSRTNSESILGAIAPDHSVDYSYGIAITSSFHPDEDTHVEPVRYGKGSNAMAMLQTVLTDGDGPGPRWRTWLKEMWLERSNVRSLYDLKHWSERTVVALVMQTLDNSITTYPKRIPGTKKWRLTSRQGHGKPNPTWIPIANKVVRKMAGVMGGTAGGSIGEPFNMPMTAHFIGGCAIGTSPEDGVVDAYQRVYGHPGLHVADGSAISANLGVNPSLTITAQAERAMSFWPNKGEEDPRPALGSEYERARARRPERPGRPGVGPRRPAAADRQRQLRGAGFRPADRAETAQSRSGQVQSARRRHGCCGRRQAIRSPATSADQSGPAGRSLLASSETTQGPTGEGGRSGPGEFASREPNSRSGLGGSTAPDL